MNEDKYTEKVLTDYGDRLDKLEEKVQTLELSNVEIKAKLSNIELSQEQIKNMINETARENQKFTMNLIEMIKEDKKVNNSIKLTDRKEIWAIISLIIGGVLAYLGLK